MNHPFRSQIRACVASGVACDGDPTDLNLLTIRILHLIAAAGTGAYVYIEKIKVVEIYYLQTGTLSNKMSRNTFYDKDNTVGLTWVRRLGILTEPLPKFVFMPVSECWYA